MKEQKNSHLTGIEVEKDKDGLLKISLLNNNSDENDPDSFADFTIRTDEYLPLINLIIGLGLKLQREDHIDLNIPDPQSSAGIHDGK